MPTLNPGKKAPNFKTLNESGKSLSLKDFTGKPLVLYFYPKDMTPGCTTESQDFRDAYKKFKKLGVEILGVSKDDEKSHQKFIKKEKLPFSLLADTQGKLCEAYGVWQEKSMYGKKYMGIVRTTVLINAKGKIHKVYDKVKVTGHVDEVLSDAEALIF